MPRHSSEKRTYLNISFGKIREKVTKETPNAVSRENKNGDTVWEIVDKSVEGKITGINYKEHSEYGNSYEITIEDGVETFNLSLHEDSKFANGLLTRLPNVDLSKFVTIMPYEFTPSDSDKKRSGLNIYQGDQKIEPYFSAKVDGKWIYKEGFPEAPTGNVTKNQWKKYGLEVQEYLYEYFKKTLKPKFEMQEVVNHDHFEDNAKDPVKTEEDDDLPF